MCGRETRQSRGGEEGEKKEMNIIIYQQWVPIVPKQRKGCNTSLFINIFWKPGAVIIHGSFRKMSHTKGSQWSPFNESFHWDAGSGGLCLCCLVIRLLAFNRQASLTWWRVDFPAISFCETGLPYRQLLLDRSDSTVKGAKHFYNSFFYCTFHEQRLPFLSCMCVCVCVFGTFVM